MNFKGGRVAISVTISIDNLNFIAKYHKNQKSFSETLNQILSKARENALFRESLKEVPND